MYFCFLKYVQQDKGPERPHEYQTIIIDWVGMLSYIDRLLIVILSNIYADAVVGH